MTSRAPSDLEVMLEEAEFPAELIERARLLREKLVAARTTKYNVDARATERIDAGGRAVILVPGQVEDDASIQRGSPQLKRNVDLLAAVRARHPDAFIVYKPHPDVEAGFRRGRVSRRRCGALCRPCGRPWLDTRSHRGGRPGGDDDVAGRLRGASARQGP